MIRTLPLVCSICGKEFKPEHEIHYQDDYSAQQIKDVKFVCDDCIRAWQEKWQIAAAEFHEADYVLTVTIRLEDGTVHEDMDCTPNEDTKAVVTAEDIPVEAQRRLYTFYAAWKKEREARQLKDCFFHKDEEGNMTATITTYGWEHYENLGIRLSEEGGLLADRDVPDYILDELLVALQSYQSQEIMLNMQSTPRSQTAPAAMKRRQARSQWPGTYQPFNSGKNDF